ncbi:1,2-phenylacetyl-CoA epoxidase subunit PaaC [Sulfitobacter guttiformis]|uniref:Ring-1,2-phenylacetyl-CoA epoxidase subunit PaaC n=1 Tax=Sulfitobacter guttiformis TaxID=74349 RepID=A0A420DIJ2_9RHOB|nr:1,2-phenylacetyl-CoA epoxidase subunit PaaC [Sulfitobacter guttiformis]KIN72193.1 Phenylacetic acid degradation protein PaaI [Sulfitobacter guttiformis KCTC 32187]RKE94034.1 ring-1,2-phenylacetyl-CoA epoxidase subunit PaaC [Sulfitobacter guttiformis]
MGNDALFQTLLRLGDNTLILGHRVSEWCGKAPVLEEDIALANTALDLIGQTQMWLGYAAEVEGANRSADDLAMLRDVWDFRNILMVERPNLDFGHTMMRQFLFDAYHHALLGALARSTDPRIAEIAAKAVKEATYHLDRSAETVIALGDGTPVSHDKMQTALNLLWPYTGEMFESDDTDAALAAQGVIPDPASLREAWTATVQTTMAEATLDIPEDSFAHKGGRTGKQHTEHLGHLLTQMQWLQRAYPDARW